MLSSAQTTRRGFLKAAIVSVAAVAIECRLSRAPTYLADEQRYTWDSVNGDYDYAIDKQHPWDVLVYDNRANEFIEPQTLKERGAILNEDGANSFDDAVDRAFLTYAALSMSQGMIGWKDAGKPGFDGPWKEVWEDVDAVVYTNSRDYYAEQGLI